MSKEVAVFGVQRALQRIDIFGKEVPSFNLNGQKKIKTQCGGFMSFVIPVVVLLFAAMKFQDLWERNNPQVSQISRRNFFSEDEKFETRKQNLKMAFTIENYLDNKIRNDTSYIKIFARIAGQKKGEPYGHEIRTHRCTEDELSEFYPVTKESEYLLQQLKTNPERGLYCFDQANGEEDDLVFYGNERGMDSARLEINVLPCNHRLSHLGGKDDRIPDDCVADR